MLYEVIADWKNTMKDTSVEDNYYGPDKHKI